MVSCSPQRRTPAYLSHSYRIEDRSLNESFWHLMWEAGLTATVDRQSAVFSAPHLEMLMRASSAYVGIVTLRADQPYYRCSPFILYEYGLAIRADKPRRMFVEAGVSDRSFSDEEDKIVFQRDGLEEDSSGFQRELKNLARETSSKHVTPGRLLGRIGLLVPESRVHVWLGDLRALIDRCGFEPVGVTPESDPVRFLRTLKSFDFVILDASPGSIPDWVHPFLVGSFVPTLTLFCLTDNFDAASAPALIQVSAIPGGTASDTPVVFWRTPGELLSQVDRHLTRILTGDRQRFRSIELGDVYFRKVGRESKRVFVSNFNDCNEFAAQLSAELKQQGIEHFQYKWHNSAIEPGLNWQEELTREINGSDLFVALITPGYWASRWTSQEFQMGLQLSRNGSVDIIPYFLKGDIKEFFEEQGRDLRDVPQDEWCAAIVKDIDNLLTRRRGPSSSVVLSTPAGNRGLEAAAITDGVSVPHADVAIITVLSDEYAAVRSQLKNPQAPHLPPEQRDRHAWLIGEITSPQRGDYRVVLALTGGQGTGNASMAVQNTVAQFGPQFVVLVGIAGGLVVRGEELMKAPAMERMKVGDVVISSQIYSYEYGKLHDGFFEPRHDLVYQCDSSLLAGAQTLPVRNPRWFDAMRKDVDADRPPHVFCGAIASGDKVVDDPDGDFFAAVMRSWPKLRAVEMEGAGAAVAIRNFVDSGRSVGFVMIRGISDIIVSKNVDQSLVRKASGGTQERDKWKAYASDSAAAFCSQLIANAWPLPPGGF